MKQPSLNVRDDIDDVDDMTIENCPEDSIRHMSILAAHREESEEH
jgi:hypothetical protein